uniref:HAT C-terminal dimerisation domain-containing protein n=1 Tax=Poecilia formosa TaxID=48698 RepID=A0A096MHK4_POEFO
VTAAELTQVYHIARHNLSYNSADCSHKLNQKCLADSKTKKITFERTKAQAIVKDVLAQKAVGDVARALTLDKPFPFSVQTDASNKGNWKVFPLAIHYFTKMLDFIENPDESAARIAALMEQLLEKFGVLLDLTAFSADNTHVNYGIHNSIFTSLRKNLLQGNCHAHIVHNTVKHGLDELIVDVENVVLKIYGYFSTSARRKFCDVEFQEILQHVATRWLFLNPAIIQLLQSWTAVKYYFINSTGRRQRKLICHTLCHTKYHTLISLRRGQVRRDVVTDICNLNLNFVYLIIESKPSSWTALAFLCFLDILKCESGRNRMEKYYTLFTHTEEHYIVYIVYRKMSDYVRPPHPLEIKEIDPCGVIPIRNLAVLTATSLSLHNGTLTFTDIERVTTILNLIHKVSMDALYDECSTAKPILKRLREDAEDEIGVTLFKEADLSNTLSIISHILSIPLDGIFSRMFNKWCDCRYRGSVELIRSELLMTLNFEQTSSEFYSSTLKDKLQQ